MCRRYLFRSTAVVLVALLLITLAQAQRPDGKGPPPRRAEQEKQAATLRAQLATPVKFSGFDDAELTFEDVFQYLQKAYGISIDVNDPAFKEEGIENLREVKLGKAMPKLTNVSLATLLRKVLERAPVASPAVFFARGGDVEITTEHAYHTEFYPGRENGPFPPLAHITIDQKPLNQVLKQLAEDADTNILLDEMRAGDSGQLLITARLADVPLDTAILLLADMAGLKMIEMDGVYYVTTKENAETLRKEREKGGPAKGAQPMPKAEPAKPAQANR